MLHKALKSYTPRRRIITQVPNINLSQLVYAKARSVNND